MVIKITYFVHGTTTDNEQNISSGWKDVDLSELGVRQSIGLKDKMVFLLSKADRRKKE